MRAKMLSLVKRQVAKSRKTYFLLNCVEKFCAERTKTDDGVTEQEWPASQKMGDDDGGDDDDANLGYNSGNINWMCKIYEIAQRNVCITTATAQHFANANNCYTKLAPFSTFCV